MNCSFPDAMNRDISYVRAPLYTCTTRASHDRFWPHRPSTRNAAENCKAVPLIIAPSLQEAAPSDSPPQRLACYVFVFLKKISTKPSDSV